jgi:LuxR family transcriptional regulator, maltose regulon positive regulatory protein
VLAAQDRVAEAWAWAREQGLSATDELSYLREFEHITLARVLQALTDQARGDVPGALVALERALTLGPRPPAPARLYPCRRNRRCRADHTRQTAPRWALSERELDVLRLLGSDLDGPDIARELTVSLNTPRTYTKSIYAKLGVNSRRAAVRQAAELNLSRTRDR